jgi:hypothetical protein
VLNPRKFVPQRALFRQGFIAVAAFSTPVFIALYAITVPNGPWQVVVITQVVATIVVTVFTSLFFRTAIWIEPEGLRERGFLGRVHTVALTEIGSVVIAETYTGGGTESHRQLFVCDRSGKQVLRMRGEFWSADDMELLASSLDVPKTTVDETVSRSELERAHPGLLYWFERHPVILALVFTVVTAVFGSAVLVVLRALKVLPG